jgi:hypothetical protein
VLCAEAGYGKEERMNKRLKVAFLVALLMGSTYFFGSICGQFGHTYELILSPSWDLLYLFLWFLLALCLVMVTAGLVAALVQPVWIALTAFAASGLVMLAGWRLTMVSAIVIAVYVLAAFSYSWSVSRELANRIKFSAESLRVGQATLMIALIIAACGSLYLGCAAHIEREGFSMPEYYEGIIMEQVEKQIEARAPAEERERMVSEFREEFPGAVEEFIDDTLNPYEKFIPLGIAVGPFMSLVTITRLLAWLPILVLRLVFSLLTALRLTKMVSETRQVQRLVIK